MSTPPPRDLTRWNRAGLARVDYVDGDAAIFLERLRRQLEAAFPGWTASQSEIDGDALKTYRRDPDDILWQLNRAYARAVHVLTGSLNASANEGWIGTATQWDSLRRLTAMLDYAPHPPASAYTTLALDFKPGQSGKLQTGFQVRYSPPMGGKPLVFETMEDLDGDAALNTLRPLDFDRNPCKLHGPRLELAGKFDKIKTGQPLVLENERNQTLQAHFITGVGVIDDADGERTVLDLSPPIGSADGFIKGYTRVHLAPMDRLAPLGPIASGAVVRRGLRLSAPPQGLRSGDIVVIGRPDGKPIYRRIQAVDGQKLAFYEDLGEVDLTGASVMTPITVPIAHLGGAKRGLGATQGDLRTLYAAGDWTWLSGRWLADVRHEGKPKHEYLPLYECTKANYFPPSTTQNGEPNPLAGYTALTLVWNKEQDRVADDTLDLSLNNPQCLLAAPRAAGPWLPDVFLQKSVDHHLTEPIKTESPKRAKAGDLAVLVQGRSLAWTRLRHVAVDAETSTAELNGEGGWRERGGGPYWLSTARVHAHFSEIARLVDWRRNNAPLTGTIIPLSAPPAAALKPGRRVLIDNGRDAVATFVLEVSPGDAATPPSLKLADAAPRGSSYGNLVVSGNIALAGHGETKPIKVLGGGNGALNHQRFLLDVAEASFIADASMAAQVRADLVVTVAGERWKQVGNLADSGPTDAHYQVRQNEDGRYWVEFGDGRRGRRLPTGGANVLVVYRQGVGAGGNLPPGKLSKPVHPNALVEAVRQPLPASGGGEREPTESLRTNAAKSLLALERAVSLSDFAALARGPAVAQAAAFSLSPGRGRRERVEVVVIPAGGGAFTLDLKKNLEDFLIAHALPGVQLTVNNYQAIPIKLTVQTRVRFDAFDPEVVRQAVRNALIAAFSVERRKLGQSLYRGEVYNVVENVSGVENSDVSIDLANAADEARLRVARDANGVILAIHPQPRQCLHLNAADPGVAVAAPLNFFL